MPVKSRREEYAEVTRGAIVAAAVERFTEEGFAGATVDAIAERARVTKGGVYHHFRDKSEIFEATFIEMEERLVKKIVGRVAGQEDPWASISTGVDLFFDECREPDFRQIVLTDAPVALGLPRWKEIEERYFLGLVKGALDLLVTSGQLDPVDTDLLSRMVMAALGEAGLAVAHSTAGDPRAEEARHSVLRLLEGFRAAPRTA